MILEHDSGFTQADFVLHEGFFILLSSALLSCIFIKAFLYSKSTIFCVIPNGIPFLDVWVVSYHMITIFICPIDVILDSFYQAVKDFELLLQ